MSRTEAATFLQYIYEFSYKINIKSGISIYPTDYDAPILLQTDSTKFFFQNRISSCPILIKNTSGWNVQVWGMERKLSSTETGFVQAVE